MKHIPIWLEQKPVKSWFSIYSFILSPASKALRKAYFTYFYCKYLFRNRNKLNKTKLNLPHSIYIERYVKIISQPNFHDQLFARNQCAEATGYIMRFMHVLLKNKRECGLNRAVSVFLQYFTYLESKGAESPYYINKGDVTNYYQDYWDVFHLCAALTHINPIKKSKDANIRTRLNQFIALSDHYLQSARHMTRGMLGPGIPLMLIDPGSFVHFHEKHIPAMDIDVFGDDDFEKLVLEFASNYSEDQKHLRYPKKK
jgi:hypothetical protein